MYTVYVHEMYDPPLMKEFGTLEQVKSFIKETTKSGFYTYDDITVYTKEVDVYQLMKEEA